jgi:DNA-binding MarR family transcriptional regulator
VKKRRLDAVIHGPIRLQICALLMPLVDAEFQLLREELRISDSVLSKHIKHLETAGYLRLRKQAFGGRQRTWVQLTPKGRKAFSAHVEELKALVALASGISPAAPKKAPSILAPAMMRPSES